MGLVLLHGWMEGGRGKCADAPLCVCTVPRNRSENRIIDGADLAHWWCSFRRPGRDTRVRLDGIVRVELDEEGLCRVLREPGWRHVFVRDDIFSSNPSTDTPGGTFRFREHALLWAAALEVASRGSDLGIGVRRDAHGQVIEEWLPEKGTRIVGHFPVWDQDVVAAMRVLPSLLRIPEALARVVDAGSAPVAELIGRRLVGEE